MMSGAEMPDIPVEAHLPELAEGVANVGPPRGRPTTLGRATGLREFAPRADVA
jgi:hypothetical protein